MFQTQNPIVQDHIITCENKVKYQRKINLHVTNPEGDQLGRRNSSKSSQRL